MFLREKKSIVGVDIGSRFIKIVGLSRSPKGFKVNLAAIEPVPVNAIVDNSIIDIDAVADSVKRAIKKSRIKPSRAVTSVPSSVVIMKSIKVPGFLRGAELHDHVMLEAEGHIPYPINEVSIDYSLIGKSSRDQDMSEIVIVASRTENIDSRVSALELAGFKAEVIDVSFSSMHRCVMTAGDYFGVDSDRTVAVIDAGFSFSRIYVYRGDEMLYFRENAFGSRSMIDEIVRRYGLSYEEAELACSTGNLPDGYREDIIDPFVDSLSQQISRYIQFFASSDDGCSIDEIVIGGGCAALPGVKDAVERNTRINSSLFSVMDFSSLQKMIPGCEEYSKMGGFMSACGLALRGLE